MAVLSDRASGSAASSAADDSFPTASEAGLSTEAPKSDNP